MRFGRETDAAMIRDWWGRIPWGVAGLIALALGVSPAPPLRAQTPPGDETIQLAGTQFSLPVSREHGFPAFRWLGAPMELVADAGVVRGAGTGSTPWGTGILVRPGAPFARVGDAVLPLVNSPYLSGHDLWVPVELLQRAESTRPPGASPRAEGSLKGASATPVPDTRPARTGPWRVTIDPGHGGHDPGTVNRRTGAREKDIVLAVSRFLRDELRERPDIEVHLTRDDDRFIKLEERPRQALANDADMFVSIHVNAEPGRGTSATGFETYYLAPARDERSAQVARQENGVVEMEGGTGTFVGRDDLDFILSGIDRDENRHVSGRLGGYVQNEMRQVAVGRDRGTKPGPFWVLVGATGQMPAVLVELGFITNAEDEGRLTDRDYQKALARALARAVEQYLEFHGGRLTAVSGAG